MSNSIIYNDDFRAVPRYLMQKLYDLDDLHKLGIYFRELEESDTYRDFEDES